MGETITSLPGNGTTSPNVSPPGSANSDCVGPSSEQAGKVSSCNGCPNQAACASGQQSEQDQETTAALHHALSGISHVILVVSGKGGVGKSTISSQLAHTLSTDHAVGLLDIDLTGPSAPRMMLGDQQSSALVQRSSTGAWKAVPVTDNLVCMSVSFLLPDKDAAVVWRGPRKSALIEQFLTQVEWSTQDGESSGLDYLIIDTPPGTSDEHISVVQFLQRANAISGAIVVTTPEEVSIADVRKELSFLRKTKIPVLGVVENMGTLQTKLEQLQFLYPDSGKDCTEQVIQTLKTKCPEVLGYVVSSKLFTTNSNSTSVGSTEAMAESNHVPFWGSIPLDPDLLNACETGQAFTRSNPDAPAARKLQKFADRLTQELPVVMEE